MTPAALYLEYERRRKYNKLAFAYPEKGTDDFSPGGTWSRHLYVDQLDFFRAGAKYKQRLSSSSNRSGKTYSAAYEVTLHLTGLYPDWWEGHRFPCANDWLIVGQTSLTTTAILQKELLGENGDFGSGMVPKHLIDTSTLPSASKVGTSIPGFRVKHVTGGWSKVSFRSQEQGILSMVGVVANVWADEPLKLNLYTELLTRTATINGLFMCTATPILGFDEFLREFCNGTWQTGEIDKHKYVVSQTWDRTPHLTKDTQEMLLASYPVYQRDCRAKGIPMLGAGAVYPVSEDMIKVEPFEIPKHWKKLSGLDVGWKAYAACWFAVNPDDNQVYVYSEYKMGEQLPSQHASNVLMRGDWIPCVVDSAAHGRSQTDGTVIFDQLQDCGLDLHNANKAVEAGLFQCHEYLANGRIKVFSTCRELLKDILSMARDDSGKIINKSSYHLADAFRYGVMGLDLAKQNLPKTSPDAWFPGSANRW